METLYAKHSSILKTSLHQAHPQLDILLVDRIAEKFLPSTETTYRPLSFPADGNCFFNAVSLKLTGSTALAGTLRLLTAIEMRTINYLPHPIPETSMALPCTLVTNGKLTCPCLSVMTRWSTPDMMPVTCKRSNILLLKPQGMATGWDTFIF